MRKIRRKNIIKDLNKLKPLEVYECLLSGDIKTFPNNFVIPENMKEIIREVILERQKLTREDICKKLNYDYLGKYKLRGSRRAFDSNIFNLISYCFPEMNIKYWELNKVEDSFWVNKENRRDYMKWLIQKEKINPSKVSDLKKIDAKLIDKNHGRRVREYGGGVYNLILLIAEIDVKEWQIIKMYNWSEEKAFLAIKWLIEEKLNWSQEEIVSKINPKVFYDNDLGGLFSNHFKNNMIKVLNLVYPGKFKRENNNKIALIQ